jgi:LytS/YehU family sensor histidine kinase
VLVLSVFAALGLQIRDERRRAQEARLQAARLEIELLKKSLQPHFLLNTLTALSEVVERDPAGAVALIDDLAAEFRTLARMSGEKQIPLAQELDLCRAHLRVMSTRTGIAWTLQTGEIDPAASVPPALFLTLIENGFVHQRRSGGSTAFQLRMEQLAGLARFVFLSPGEMRTNPGRPAGGSGLRYVMARLEESFPQRWSFDQHAVASGWETVIEIRGSA